MEIGCLNSAFSMVLSRIAFKKNRNIKPKIIGSVGTNKEPIGVSKLTDKGTAKETKSQSLSKAKNTDHSTSQIAGIANPKYSFFEIK
jgi:hypothetical protein